MKINREKLRTFYPWITLLALVLVVGIMDPSFLHPHNLINVAGDVSPLFIMALGITFAIYIGGIDLSSQSVVNMTTVLACLAIETIRWFLLLLFCILAGIALGTISGAVSAWAKVPTFITTLSHWWGGSINR